MLCICLGCAASCMRRICPHNPHHLISLTVIASGWWVLVNPVRTAADSVQIVKGPVTKYFPPNCERVGFSHSAPSIVTLREFVEKLPNETPAVFVVGAMAHGKVDVTYVDQMISISEYPLSAACCLGRITNSFEWKWGIV